MRQAGSVSGVGFHALDAMIGKATMLSASKAMCVRACVRAARRVSPCAYAYPASSTAWKNTTHVVQTAAEPPNHGRICLAMMGCTRNSRNADVTIVMPYRIIEFE